MVGFRYFVPAAALLLWIPPVHGQKAKRPKLPDGVKLVAGCTYAERPSGKLLLDLYLPAEKPKRPLPVVVWVHGGGWNKGSKDNCPAVYLATHGYAVASINYRLSTVAPWPAQIDDCRDAARWLRKNAGLYNLDANHIGAWGGSAGGHIVALWGTLPTPPSEAISSKIQAVCDWYGPSDLLTMPANVLSSGKTLADLAKSNGAQLLGGIVKDHPDKARGASALYQVRKDSAPFLIMHGDKDPAVPLDQSQRLADKLKAAGVPVTFHVLAGAGHGGKLFQTPEIRRVIREFFDRHLQERGERLVLASASYGNNLVAICDAEGKVLWSHKTAGPRTGHAGHHDIQLLDNGNILFHDDWTTIKEMTLDHKVVWTYDSATMNGNKGKRVDVHAFRRLPSGLTMIAESGVGRIIEVDKEGKIQSEVKLKQGGKQNTRMARKLDSGNYLVCAENPGVVTEYNPKGDVVWEYPIKTRVFGAIRLRSGNTLIASGGGASVLEVTPDGKIVWEIKDVVPDTNITLKWTTFLTELDNGNFIVGNCHAGKNSPQIFEITRDRKVVWQFNQFETFGNGLACSQALSAEQSAMVRKLLAASLRK